MRTSVSLAGAVAALWPLAGSAAAADGWPGADVLQGIKRTQELVAAGCSFEAASGTKSVGGSTPTGVYRYRFAPAHYLCETGQGEDRPRWESVLGYTDRYGYRLAQKPPRPAWNVTALELGRPAAMLQRGRPKAMQTLSELQVKLLAVQFLDVEGIPLDALVTHPSFSASEVTADGPRVRVRFAADAPSTIGPDRVTGGELVLLPPSYAVDEYQITIRTPDPTPDCRVRMKMEWAAADPPTPALHTVTYADAKPPIVLTRRFTNWAYGPQEPAAFAITQFGLPEPAPEPVPGRSRYFYLGAAVLLACGVVGYLLRRK